MAQQWLQRGDMISGELDEMPSKGYVCGPSTSRRQVSARIWHPAAPDEDFMPTKITTFSRTDTHLRDNNNLYMFEIVTAAGIVMRFNIPLVSPMTTVLTAQRTICLSNRDDSQCGIVQFNVNCSPANDNILASNTRLQVIDVLESLFADGRMMPASTIMYFGVAQAMDYHHR
jgi:hypothetical protein